MKRIPRIAAGTALVISLFSGHASAEHEADHRYTIRGYVLEQSEAPVSDVDVLVRLGDRSVGSARTDGQGYYTVRMHLHDRDIGKKLTVRAGESTTTIRMAATRGDRTESRVHYVNFVAGNAVEGKLGGWRFPAWVYVTVLLLVSIVAVALLAHRTNKIVKRRRARSVSGEQKRRSKKHRKSKKH